MFDSLSLDLQNEIGFKCIINIRHRVKIKIVFYLHITLPSLKAAHIAQLQSYAFIEGSIIICLNQI